MAKNKHRTKSPMNENSFDVDDSPTAIGEYAPPGTETRGTDITLEDLGKLSEFPNTDEIENSEEGSGDWCVVLSDYFSGAGDMNFLKGHVRRLSHLIPDYENKDVSRDVIKSRIKRYFDLGQLRKATKDERGADRIEVTLESESGTTQAERNRRIAAEDENVMLRRKLMEAGVSLDNMTPGKAGASEEAQLAVVTDNEDEEEVKGSDWE